MCIFDINFSCSCSCSSISFSSPSFSVFYLFYLPFPALNSWSLIPVSPVIFLYFFLSNASWTTSVSSLQPKLSYSKENLKIHTGPPSLPFPPFPSPLLPPLSPYLPLPILPFPPCTLSLSLEVGPLYSSYRRSGERCKLPQRSVRRTLSRNCFWCILALKSGIMVATSLLICLRSVNDVTVSDYVKWFLKIGLHNLTFKDAQINFNDTQFVHYCTLK